MMTREEIEKKLAQLRQQQEQTVANVNYQLGVIAGQIAAYEALLAETEPEPAQNGMEKEAA